YCLRGNRSRRHARAASSPDRRAASQHRSTAPARRYRTSAAPLPVGPGHADRRRPADVPAAAPIAAPAPASFEIAVATASVVLGPATIRVQRSWFRPGTAIARPLAVAPRRTVPLALAA